MAYYIVRKTGKRCETIPTAVFEDPERARRLLNRTRWKILSEFSRGSCCARELASRMGLSEQTASYHIKALKRSGLITLDRTEERRGAVTKFYSARRAAISVIPRPMSTGDAGSDFLNLILDPQSTEFLNPFVTNSGLNGLVVVGSPDAHGEFKQRARDAHYASDLALFLGSLSPPTRRSATRLDAGLAKAEMRENLILLGGPRVNTVTLSVNDQLPIKFDLERNLIVSTVSGRRYYEEGFGVVEKIVNPFNEEKAIIVLAGNTQLGTKAAVTAIIMRLREVSEGNLNNNEVRARVVLGLDLDSDGVIDDVEFSE